MSSVNSVVGLRSRYPVRVLLKIIVAPILTPDFTVIEDFLNFTDHVAKKGLLVEPSKKYNQ